MTEIFAHRGASGYEPENTMESFRLADRLGADGIEFDVHLTKDGIPVIIHDEKTDRTSNGSGYVKDMTLEELRKFNFHGKFPEDKQYDIPTLEQVLEFAKDTELKINIELKTDVFEYPGIEEKVLKFVYDLGLQKKVILSSFNPDSVERVKKQYPEIVTALITEIPEEKDTDTAGRIGATALHPSKKHFDIKSLEKIYFESGLDLRVWTLNKEDEIQAFFDKGVTGIFTNYPDIALKIRKKYTEDRRDDMKKYDVGIFGWWYNMNYGANLTYFSLNRAIQKMGFSVGMVWKAINPDKLPDNPAIRFAKKYYELGSAFSAEDMYKHNDYYNAFLLGSDQLWSPTQERNSGKDFFFDFVDDEKNKIAYAQSIGRDRPLPEDFVEKYKSRVHRFNGISVREDYAVDVVRKGFLIDVPQVCDPIFLSEREVWDELIENADIELPSKYILNLILDPDQEKMDFCKTIRNDLGYRNYINFTALTPKVPWKKGFGKEPVDNSEGTIENLVKAYSKADYIITDSFHGTCLAVIMNKPFISIANYKRGAGRFESLLRWLKLEERLVHDVKETIDVHHKALDYEPVNKIISKSSEEGRAWLKQHLEKKMNLAILPENELSEKEKSDLAKLNNNPDFKKIRILATLLRDYGIKHIVLSPGGRDVPLVRIFENNSDTFTLHRVTDERSAAYYGLGLATQLRSPVACVCTSGTAVSNYLPAVTEAFYTGVPLVMITADRYSVFHEHGEDQTIPQSNVFDNVIKKSVTLPEGKEERDLYQTRRDISDCILESTHNGFGPVHINIAIGNIKAGAALSSKHWKILPKLTPHILRVGLNDTKDTMMKWVNALKRSERVLLVYGQNPPTDEKQQKNIEAFVSKYNCVVTTDHISNLSCKYELGTYNMIQGITQKEFDEKLSPDIVITVGGKRLMNDSLTYKIRGGSKSIRHWSVVPDGRIRDFYFRLSSVLEMSQDKFFEFFAENAGDIKNNENYYNSWKEIYEKHPSPIIEDFNANYIQSKFLPSIPKGSLLHLGVGQSFYDCRKYHIDDEVEVFCNMGTNGIDGCTSTFMGQSFIAKDRLCFLLVGDLSFFYDMNSIWNKPLHRNMRILMVNNNGSGLLRGHRLKGVTSKHDTEARGWVESTGFKYMSANDREEYEEKLSSFIDPEGEEPLFFEVFCN